MAGCVQNKSDDAAFFDSLKGSIDAFVDVNQYPAEPDYFERVIQGPFREGSARHDPSFNPRYSGIIRDDPGMRLSG